MKRIYLSIYCFIFLFLSYNPVFSMLENHSNNFDESFRQTAFIMKTLEPLDEPNHSQSYTFIFFLRKKMLGEDLRKFIFEGFCYEPHILDYLQKNMETFDIKNKLILVNLDKQGLDIIKPVLSIIKDPYAIEYSRDPKIPTSNPLVDLYAIEYSKYSTIHEEDEVQTNKFIESLRKRHENK